MSAISSQQQLLSATLQKRGWAIVERTTDLEWWADEVWTVESEWSPVGLRVFIAFLVNPFPYSANRKKGRGVWSVQCTNRWPEDAENCNKIAEFPLKRWDANSAKLVERIGAFRSNENQGG